MRQRFELFEALRRTGARALEHLADARVQLGAPARAEGSRTPLPGTDRGESDGVAHRPARIRPASRARRALAAALRVRRDLRRSNCSSNTGPITAASSITCRAHDGQPIDACEQQPVDRRRHLQRGRARGMPSGPCFAAARPRSINSRTSSSRNNGLPPACPTMRRAARSEGAAPTRRTTLRACARSCACDSGSSSQQRVLRDAGRPACRAAALGRCVTSSMNCRSGSVSSKKRSNSTDAASAQCRSSTISSSGLMPSRARRPPAPRAASGCCSCSRIEMARGRFVCIDAEHDREKRRARARISCASTPIDDDAAEILSRVPPQAHRRARCRRHRAAMPPARRKSRSPSEEHAARRTATAVALALHPANAQETRVSKRVLPVPASATMLTSCVRPASMPFNARVSSASSCSRPINGAASPCACKPRAGAGIYQRRIDTVSLPAAAPCL